jgi:hypothetical protein
MNGADIGVRTKPNFCRKGLAPIELRIDDAERYIFYPGDDHIIHITSSGYSNIPLSDST